MQNTVAKICPMCGNAHKIVLTKEESFQYLAYTNIGGHIQDMFPHFNPMEREFLMTGYCPKCQKTLFGSSYKSERMVKAKPEEAEITDFMF